MEEQELGSMKQCSIEINKTSKGEFSFKMKIYYDDDRRDADDVIKELRKILDKLEKEFK